MTAQRVGTLFVLLYLTLDYSTPSVPGVFSFDTDAFYLDGVVDARCVATPPTPSFAAPPAMRTRTDCVSAAHHAAPSLARQTPPDRSVAAPRGVARRHAIVAPSGPLSEDH